MLRYEKAVDMLHRQSAVLRKLANRSHLYKANLSVLIVLFAVGDEVEAGKQFNFMCRSVINEVRHEWYAHI